MDNLIQLVKSLNNRQINLIKDYYSINRKKDSLLRLKLMLVIKGDTDLTQEGISKSLGRKFTRSSLRMLATRLQEDILKVLIFYRDRDKTITNVYQAKWLCRRMTIEVNMLLNAGITGLALERLKKADRLARKYELTMDKLIIDEQMQTTLGLRKGFKVYNKTVNDLQSNLATVDNKLKAQDTYRRLLYPYLFSINKEVLSVKESFEATIKLKQLTLTDNSAEIKFFYLRSEIYYHHLIRDFQVAYKYALEFLEFTRTSRIMSTNDNMGGAYIQLSNIALLLGEYELAVNHVKEGIGYFTPGSRNVSMLYDNMFLGLIHLREYDKAEEVVKILNDLKVTKGSKYYQGIYIFYSCNLLFLRKQFHDSLALLQKQSALLSDKSGWLLGYRILEMMCIIELGNYDWLDYRIETFRKLLSTVKDQNIARAKSIMIMIKQFIKSGYKFDVVSPKASEQLKLLVEGKGEYFFDINAFEIIRFDEWWNSKVKAKTRVKAS